MALPAETHLWPCLTDRCLQHWRDRGHPWKFNVRGWNYFDNYLRAFDSETGEELWRGNLPASGQAGPMTFISEESGTQYVVVPAGGHISMQADIGDAVVAFKLIRR